jgi:regulatory protein
MGYVDDAAYARARARALLAGGRAGPGLAERRLHAAGVDEAVARDAVREAQEGATEAALCRAALGRRLHGQPLDVLDEGARARLARWLVGRGFSAEAATRAVGLRDEGTGSW